MRNIASVIAGLVITFLIVGCFYMLATMLHPVPPVERPDAAVLATWMTSAPLAAKIVLALAWLVGGMGGAIAALRISGGANAAWIVAGLAALLAFANLSSFAPVWMQACGAIAPLVGGWIAIRLGRGGSTGDPIES